MGSMLQVKLVTTRRDHHDFCLLPYKLYANDKRWIAPLRSEEFARWNPRKNAALHDIWQCRFLARRGDRVVGRIAAIINPSYANRWYQAGGLFGFFESENCDDTAGALLNAAGDTLQRKGITRIVGPINLTTHDETGILVSGFDSAPTMLTPYNPSFYEQLLANQLYRIHSEYFAYAWSTQCSSRPSVDRLLRHLKSSTQPPLRIRSFADADWKVNVQIVHDLYNRSFAQTPGFVPIGASDFQGRANQFRQFYWPDMCLIAELNGQPIGFAIVLPDINEALSTIGGSFFPFGWLKLLRAVSRIEKARFILLGVVPEFAGKGISIALIDQVLRTARKRGIQSAELSLIHAENAKVQHVIEAFGVKPSKTYRMYEKDLVSHA